MSDTLCVRIVRSLFIRQGMSNDQKKKISSDLSGKFQEFITEHPPSLFSRRLRYLLLDYMIQQQKNGFVSDFDIFLWELSDLFDLLDCASDEWENQKKAGSAIDQ